MKRLFFTAFLAGLALTLMVSAASADLLWGTTNGINDSGFWTGGQIFTVDTATGTVNIKATYAPSQGVSAFGDIAVRANGEVYTTYMGDNGFNKLAKVNTTTWAFDWVQNLGGWNDQVNALTFKNDTLYGVTGGGIPANLIQFTLTGNGATATNLGNIGTNSDGDIAVRPSTGTMYYTSWETGNTSELNTINFGPPPSKTGKEISTSNGWAGLVFSQDSTTLYAGTWNDQKLYTLDFLTANPNFTATVLYDLSGSLGGNITGLDQVPLPGTVVLLGSGLAGLAFYRRRLGAAKG